MIINLGCASVDNHIPRDDIFDYHPRRECNIYIILEAFENASPYFFTFLQTVYAIEKKLAGINVQPRIDINQSLI